MSESNIFKVLEEFKTKYAWDKSLMTGHDSAPTPALELRVKRELADTSLRDFLASQQAKASAREAHESF